MSTNMCTRYSLGRYFSVWHLHTPKKKKFIQQANQTLLLCIKENNQITDCNTLITTAHYTDTYTHTIYTHIYSQNYE